MSDLLWPGDARSGEICTDASVLAAMLRVESAWLDSSPLSAAPPALDAPASGSSGSASPGSGPFGSGLLELAGPDDLADLAAAAEEGGNPVIPLLALLRSRLGDDPRAASLHRGLTSQDVLDTALVLCLRDAAARIRDDLAAQIVSLAALADRHRHTDMAGRTLTQHAVPITFGLKAAGWLQGVLDARDLLAAAADLPVQIGGAAGSLAAVVAIEGSPDRAVARVAATAARLGLPPHQPWHTSRASFTRFGDALVTCTDAWGRIANDVLTLARPEIGELSLAQGGGSSAMPNKRNPTLAVLVRRAALAGPSLAATLHTAAATMVDERADGAWHVEWATLRTLARRAVTAGSQTTDMLAGLRVDEQRMAATLAAARPGIDAEQRKYGMAGGAQPDADATGLWTTGPAGLDSRVESVSSSPGRAGGGDGPVGVRDGSSTRAASGDPLVSPGGSARGGSGRRPYRGATDEIIDAALKRAGEK
ncbi:lyase family protein [Paractinoplanes hotanensis]|uniref:Lyase family protein n=1 Tax=Paractinoplanes hotanensis TaxID=2906497 RepID=A0ABT0Y1M5_9ACTN|nr:lyase family protein [Actinoplanes hotanensis]MCM4079785.1 lyase family protein [Actinoplanes hotanensis]